MGVCTIKRDLPIHSIHVYGASTACWSLSWTLGYRERSRKAWPLAPKAGLLFIRITEKAVLKTFPGSYPGTPKRSSWMGPGDLYFRISLRDQPSQSTEWHLDMVDNFTAAKSYAYYDIWEMYCELWELGGSIIEKHREVEYSWARNSGLKRTTEFISLNLTGTAMEAQKEDKGRADDMVGKH